MSIELVQKYLAEKEKIIQYGGSRNEGALSPAFQNLLNEYCKTKGLLLIPQLDCKTSDGKAIRPDGTVKDMLRLDWGYWESKDKYDDIDKEIQFKLSKGYPTSNIIFEDSNTAILIQSGNEILRIEMNNPTTLDRLLIAFVNYERPEVRDFRSAIEKFKEDIPAVVGALREMIESEIATNKELMLSLQNFLTICQKAINPFITPADIREMIIQHILTEEIFLTVFNESQFHRENNIAHELEKVVGTFFKGDLKRATLDKMDNYYKVIKRTATDIYNHYEKQKFLKVIYEKFYKAYNPQAAERLGIFYTPNEIVKFMVETTDDLLYRHFGVFLADKNVEILDPFTGTGTYITEIIDYISQDKIEYKYRNEIHCNEVAILPYYIANLNIEYTYKQKTGNYEEFKNICFVDTLDNVGFGWNTKQEEIFGIAIENADRIKRQNERKISVIISNPPYRANQKNENENNKNRVYPAIDKRIKDTYIKFSHAQKTKMYDIYSRSLRWASDRLFKNGIVAFVSNNSFIDKKTFDGFRKVVAEEFNEIYIIDLKGDARTSGERRRKEGGNVFSDQIRVGVCIYFLIRKEDAEGCKIFYNAIKDYAHAEEKKNYLTDNKFSDLNFTHILPDKDHNWINLSDNDFETLIPLANKQTKFTKKKSEENAIFKIHSLGVVTARDEWVYDDDEKYLKKKIRYFIDRYNQDIEKYYQKVKISDIKDVVDYSIKWTRALKNDLSKGKKNTYNKKFIVDSVYRPFIKKRLYFDHHLNEMQYQLPSIFPHDRKVKNIALCINVGNKLFNIFAVNSIPDYHYNGDSICFPIYKYLDNKDQHDNITDWGLAQFRDRYSDEQISREDIFRYVYAVLHNPVYRQKYALNLRREFPRIPFYENFHQWVEWGQQLMDLHLNYEDIEAFTLRRIDIQSVAGTDRPVKVLLKADKATGKIFIDEVTTLEGVPASAWEYMLGNRSALEWILDQYKEKKPKDPTIREKFNTYKFADYKEKVIDLIMRVCTVSIRTVEIVKQMEKAGR